MSVSVDFDENEDVRVTDQAIDTASPDGVVFAAEGVIQVTERLLGEFAGRSLRPVGITVSVDESDTVEIDLEEASLRLDAVDVGVETPGSDDSPTTGTRPSKEGIVNSADTSPGAIAFTVEGVITGLSDETVARLGNGSPRMGSVRFAVEGGVRSDGGSDDGVVFEFTLFGFDIVVRRNGVIDIGVGPTDLGSS